MSLTDLLFKFNIIFSYFINKLKSIFQPEPDMRFKLRYNPESRLMENQVGDKLSTIELDNDYEITIVQDNLKYKLPYVNYDVFKIFYGFPSITNKSMKIIVESLEDEKIFSFEKNQIINFKEIFP